MMKRITWFTSGLLAGLTGAWYGSRKLKEKAESLKPVNVARDAANRVRDRVDDVVDAIREGRTAMHDKELELRTVHDRDGSSSEVVSVEPGRVVVLRSVDGRGPGRRVRRRRP
jgi:hypothetical protein